MRFRVSGPDRPPIPCAADDLSDERVGQARSYVRLDEGLTDAGWLEGIREGRSDVSDGGRT